MLTTVLILFLLGCLSGVCTVLFGFGGGFVTVPVVYAVAAAGPQAMHVAVATSAAVMVVNSGWASLSLSRSGRLSWAYLWPLGGFVAVGAGLGAFAAHWVPDHWLHVAFVAYMAATILDAVLRRGFVTAGGVRPLDRVTVTAGGVGIGVLASVLGVGGSVLTVPLLRRRGLPMADATAMANPLTFVVAIVAVLVYLSGPGVTGSVDPVAAAALLAGSLPAIAVVRRWCPPIPDRAHALAYIGLLIASLAVII
ncbi:sulfite exporter TauE/SafE family protein [Pseudonocardiaceae bacterium YIM PH 21723]|nr:sulfite exporter TauE/SafE family protein [Pseudonocardiaceae bacterium YIM PH 21723]